MIEEYMNRGCCEETMGKADRDRGQVDTQVVPIFEINKNWHPDYTVYPPKWEIMTLKEYMNEFQVGVDEINELIRNRAIRLVSA